MNPEVYVFLHRLTFVPHVLCAGFVLAATLGTAGHGIRQLVGSASEPAPLAAIWRDLAPFVLGLAITFGVGPLLFTQLLDGHSFYSAGVLLSHRFMAILPALIAGFYLLYLQKAPWGWCHSRWARAALPLAALGSFAFTAWSWTALSLLAQAPESWPTVYAAGPSAAPVAGAAPRLTTFVGLALVSLAVLTALDPRARTAALGRRLAQVAVLGAITTLAGLLTHAPVEGVSLLGARGLLTLAGLGTTLTVLVRGALAGRPVLGLPRVGMVAGLLLAIESVASLRDAVRLARGQDPGRAVEGATADGFTLFVVVLVAVTAAIAWALLRVRKDLHAHHGTPDRVASSD